MIYLTIMILSSVGVIVGLSILKLGGLINHSFFNISLLHRPKALTSIAIN